ncbi:MAG: nitroreductase family protein [Candidatus Zixiibacteriota bacterium]
MSDSIFFKRHSKRAYLDKAIPDDVLERLFEKIRWSPSCANKQPWKFIFVREQTQHAKLGEALARGNEWAMNAPALVAVCARKDDDYNREDDPVTYYQFDCGLAVMSMLLAAVDEDLMGHPMAGYDAPKVKEALAIPNDFHVICVIALGYEGSIASLDERNRIKDEAPRTRKEIAEIIALDKFDFKE